MIGSEILVLGSGIAGLSFALLAAEFAPVTLLTKRALQDANTRFAQGGVSAVLGPDDDFEQHIEDTLIAGAGLCRPEAVRLCVERGPAAIRHLAAWGARFDRLADGALSLGREGGHSQRRIVHAGDITGAEIERALVAAVRAHARIQIYEHHHGVALATEPVGPQGAPRCVGVHALDVRGRRLRTFAAAHTVLATGGAGALYRYTSNPPVATADGVAMAWRAGAQVANLEFYQFHPTAMPHPRGYPFLISEALRGEGGELRNVAGQPFMRALHPLGSLAPRDIVARAIVHEMAEAGGEHVWLDMTHLEGGFLARRFPNIHQACLEAGVDLRTQPIPVTPAAHYACGGVQVNLAGRSSLAGLSVIGEAACTGLHGANRLASNSLLEGVVYAQQVAEDLQQSLQRGGARASVSAAERLPEPGAWVAQAVAAPSADEVAQIEALRAQLQRLMWAHVGILRSGEGLRRAREMIAALAARFEREGLAARLCPEALELRSLLTVAALTVRSALAREESRGGHYRLDHPEVDDERFLRETVLEGCAAPEGLAWRAASLGD